MLVRVGRSSRYLSKDYVGQEVYCGTSHSRSGQLKRANYRSFGRIVPRYASSECLRILFIFFFLLAFHRRRLLACAVFGKVSSSVMCFCKAT